MFLFFNWVIADEENMMGKKIATLITGVLFGLSLFYAFYLFLVLGIAFGIATSQEGLFYISYLFLPMGLVALIGGALAIKYTKATRIMLLIPTIFFLFASVYSFILGAFSISYLITIIIIFGTGFTATLLAFLTRKEVKHVLAHAGDIKADKESMKLDAEDKEN